LITHPDDDQVVPFEVGGRASAARIKGATLTAYPGAPHATPTTHRERLVADLRAFLESQGGNR
jgi:non-heme chloroperoxidase